MKDRALADVLIKADNVEAHGVARELYEVDTYGLFSVQHRKNANSSLISDRRHLHSIFVLPSAHQHGNYAVEREVDCIDWPSAAVKFFIASKRHEDRIPKDELTIFRGKERNQAVPDPNFPGLFHWPSHTEARSSKSM